MIMENKKEIKPSSLQDLSDIKVDNNNEDDFLIDICRIMKNNEEYQELSEKPNFGIEVVSEDRKEVKEADNVYTIKHFVANNLKKIESDKHLQKEIKTKLDRLKKIIVNQEGTEYAQLMMLELQINDMLNEDIGDND